MKPGFFQSTTFRLALALLLVQVAALARLLLFALVGAVEI